MTTTRWPLSGRKWSSGPTWGRTAPWFERALARNPDCAFAWREDGRVIGTVVGAWDGLRGWIYHLAVAKAHQNRGIGSKLLAAAEQKLWVMGVQQINLMVYEENPHAETLYRRRGYETSPVKVLRKRFA